MFVTSAKRVCPPRQSVRLQHAKCVRLQYNKCVCVYTINAFVIYLEGGSENLRKSTETKEKSFCKTLFQLGMHGPEKIQKQGRDERTQEDYPTSAVYF